MSTLTLLLLVDAFRPDYLRDAPYLHDLAAEGVTGRLRETFGFLPRAAYFGGLSPEQSGYTNMLCCDPARSPFAAARWLPRGAFTTASAAADVRAYVDGRARACVPAYAASYVSSLQIPVEILPHLAMCEVEAPWSAKAGYRSIFHELDARGDGWLAEAWPTTNLLADRSDAALVERVLDGLRPEHRFAYCHLQELDAAGHAYGPEGLALRRLVHETDALVARLVEGLRTRVDALNVIVFGDHGMLPVTRAIDVRPALAATGLIPGVDYVYFLDSTMVRLWFLTGRSRAPLIEALVGIPGLQLVTPEDKVRHRIAGCHPSNAHEILLADPGVVISPDFFSNAAPLGMHGYDPDCRDNQGVFLVHAPGLAAGDAGIVDATQIYDWTRELLGLAAPRPDRVPAICPSVPRFTQSPLPAADAAVAAQLEMVLEHLEPLTARAEAVVLTGSFGRGEGGTVATGAAVLAVNDFDLVVVGGPDISRELSAIGPDLAAQLGLDFLDLGWSDGTWSDVSATMSSLDLRYGSQVLRGAPDVMTRRPPIAAAEITMQDGLTLLLNRAGGILSGMDGDMLAGGLLDMRASRYLCNQIVKALVAVGDTHLIEWRAYDPSYRTRRERFASLAGGAGVPDAEREAIDCAYRLKVLPDYDELCDPIGAALAATPVLIDRLCRVAEATIGRRLDTLPCVALALRDVGGAWVSADNARLLACEKVARLVASRAGSAHSIRQAIYAALPLLLAAIALPGFDPAGPVPHLPGLVSRTLQFDDGEDWETLRAGVVSGWLAMIH